MGGQGRRRAAATSGRSGVGGGNGSDGKAHRRCLAAEQCRDRYDQALRDQNHQGAIFDATGGNASVSAAERNFALGVDIGGTKVAVGLVDHEGNIVAQTRKPMIANGSAEAGLQAVIDAIDSLTGTTQFHRIGVCAPGPLDPKTGVVLNPPNLPCWRNFPLGAKLAEKYEHPVKVDNDANAAALAETRWGAARGYHYVFYGTVGTGIGTGIVLDGRIYHGYTGAAAEGGHVTIDYHGPVCNCGKLGCIEILAAGPAIGKRARAKLAADS